MLGNSVLLQGSVFSVPTGSGTEEKKRYCENWVKEYLSLVYRHPKIPFFFYISGTLLEFFESKGKEYHDVLRELMARKQIELLGGMYYDAAPMVQAKKDQRDQLEKLHSYLTRNYRIRVKGAWITPGTYDHSIVQTLKQGGVRYILADRAFLEPLPDYSQFGLLEHLGIIIRTLPYNRDFVYQFFDTEYSKQFVKRLTSDAINTQIHILFSEYHDVSNTKAFFKSMDTLLCTLEDHDCINHCMVPNILMNSIDAFESQVCRLRVAPYGDEESESFLRYIHTRPESRLLYGRLQYLMKISDNQKKDKIKQQSLRVALWSEQNHFSYWTSGRKWGINYGILRQNTYRAFNVLEKNLLSAEQYKNRSTLKEVDMNLDAKNEFLFTSSTSNILIEPLYGSICMLERTAKAKQWNYLSCYVPHPSPQHPPWTCKDFLLPAQVDSNAIHKDMLNNVYQYHPLTYHTHTSDSNKYTVEFSTASNTYGVSCTKFYAFKANSVDISYTVSNTCNQSINVMLALEVNFSFRGDDASILKLMVDDNQYMGNQFQVFTTDRIQLLHYHKKEQIQCTTSESVQIYVAPVYGSSHMLDNERQYQYTALFFVFPVALNPHDSIRKHITLSFSAIVTNAHNK